MDTFRKVAPGEGLSIPAEAYNAFIDAAIAERGGRFGGGANGVTFPERRGDVIRVRNDSGSDLSQFDVVALGDPIVTPTELLAEFKRQIALGVTVPATGDEATWGVLLEPVPEDGYGRAVVAGVAIVQIAVTSGTASYAQAEITDGETTLVLSATGSAKVLWRESGTSGTKWAVVRIGAVAASSSAGDETAYAFPQTERDYVTFPTLTGGSMFRWRDGSGVINQNFVAAAELAHGGTPFFGDTGAVLPQNCYHLLPFVAKRSTVNRLAVSCETGDTITIRMAIYSDHYTQSGGGIHYPNALIHEESSFTWTQADPALSGSSGLNISGAISVSLTERALYWMAVCFTYPGTNPQMMRVQVIDLLPTLGYQCALVTGSGLSHIAPMVGLRYTSGGVTIPSAAFPDPFPGTPSSPQSGVNFIVGSVTIGSTADQFVPIPLISYGP